MTPKVISRSCSNFQKLAEKYNSTPVHQIAKKIAKARNEDISKWRPKIDRLWKAECVPELHTLMAVQKIGIGCSLDELMAAIAEDHPKTPFSQIFMTDYLELHSQQDFRILENRLEYEVFPNNDTKWEKFYDIRSLVSDLVFLKDIEICHSTGKLSTFSDSKDFFLDFGERDGFRHEHFSNIHFKSPLQEGDEVSFSIAHRSTGATKKDANSVYTKIRVPTDKILMNVYVRERETACTGKLYVYENDNSYARKAEKEVIEHEWNEEISGFSISLEPRLGYWYDFRWDG